MVVLNSMSKFKVSVSDSVTSSVEDSDDQNNEIVLTEVNNGDENNDLDEHRDENDTLLKSEGWADSVAKILASNKPKNKKTLVLSRAKKYSDVIKVKKEEKPTFEIIGETKEEKLGAVEVKPISEPIAKKKRIDKPSIRVKPNILEKDREKLLSKIATKGVVQLFNAVRNQQKTLERTESSNLPDGKKEKIMKKFDKRTFLDSLMGPTKSIIVDEHTKSYKDDLKDENKPKWNALRDDFMMGAKMKDWDKEPDE